jgi:hypothetical protein
MAAIVKLITTRDNTNTEFWWTTTDPAVASLRNAALAVANQMNIPNEIAVSADELSCSIAYSVDSEQQWQDFVAAVAASQPTLSDARNAYHTNAGHTLKLEARIPETKKRIRDITIV